MTMGLAPPRPIISSSMRQFYFWTMYGDHDEIVFHYTASRAPRHAHTLLGDFHGTLLSDGYGAYAAYAGKRA